MNTPVHLEIKTPRTSNNVIYCSDKSAPKLVQDRTNGFVTPESRKIMSPKNPSGPAKKNSKKRFLFSDESIDSSDNKENVLMLDLDSFPHDGLRMKGKKPYRLSVRPRLMRPPTSNISAFDNSLFLPDDISCSYFP